ncbi:putative transmembrane protein [Trifolium repens]|nr:putative transmembrane protein [Trifolium repens]
MGSLEEDELVKMVQDFIESDHSSNSPTSLITSSNHHPLHNRTQYFILQDILRGDTSSSEAKIMKYVLKHMRSRNGYEKTTILSRWLVKRMRKDGLNASLYQTSWSTSLGCPAGEYEYIEVIIEDEKNINDPMRLIVDIDFKSQFELARPTEYYKELTNSLPLIFVGRENKLSKIISLLCSAAKQSLREKGLHVPPWRTNAYMQSKWLSRCHKEPNIIGNISNKVVSIMKPRKRDLSGGESELSSQLSNMSINCC